MEFTGVYAITDDQLLPPGKLLSAVEAALKEGIALLQYRSKSTSHAHRLNAARTLLALTTKFGVPLIINDDVELCLEVGAAGVHLGRQDASLLAARARLGPDAIIGITCHDSLASAKAAAQQGADYVAFGRFFPSHTKPTASPAPLSLLSEARRQLDIPIVAIGGINAENGAAVIQAGADMLAVIHEIFAAADIGLSTRELVRLCKKLKQ